MNIRNIPNYSIGYTSNAVKPGYGSSPQECQTCKNRKSASHISPASSGARVRAHEAEHVSNAYTKAAQNHGEVISASVSIRTAVCPECGRTYTAGGETTTVIKYSNESNPYQQNKKSLDAAIYPGKNIDLIA